MKLTFADGFSIKIESVAINEDMSDIGISLYTPDMNTLIAEINKPDNLRLIAIEEHGVFEGYSKIGYIRAIWTQECNFFARFLLIKE